MKSVIFSNNLLSGYQQKINRTQKQAKLDTLSKKDDLHLACDATEEKRT